MAKRQGTLKKKVSKRQTRKFSKKGGSKKGGSKKGGSKKGGRPTPQSRQAELRAYKAEELKILNEHKADAKARGIKIEMMDEMKDMETYINPGGTTRDKRIGHNTVNTATQNFKSRFNSKGIMHTPINNNNINELIKYGNEYGFTKSLKLLFEKSKEKGLELSEDSQKLANKYLEQEPPVPQEP